MCLSTCISKSDQVPTTKPGPFDTFVFDCSNAINFIKQIESELVTEIGFLGNNALCVTVDANECTKFHAHLRSLPPPSCNTRVFFRLGYQLHDKKKVQLEYNSKKIVYQMPNCWTKHMHTHAYDGVDDLCRLGSTQR